MEPVIMPVKTKTSNIDVESLEFDGDTVLCRVCGDKASGFHYGVHACEGCKGFFRRSIQQKIQYRPCLKNQQCNIMRVNRNRCQYCRLKKCIAVGMSRDAVRFGRVPKKEKAKILEQMQKVNLNSQYNYLHAILQNEANVIQQTIKAHVQTCDYTREKFERFQKKAWQRPEFVNCPAHRACPLNPNPGEEGDGNKWQDFSDSFTPAIQSVVDFAKGIPGFQVLNQEDQVTLLKAGTFEVLLLRLGCMFDTQTNTMLFTNGKLYRRPSSVNGTVGFLEESMFDFADRLNELRLTDNETALFSAVVIIAADRPGLRNPEPVERIQSKITQGLQAMILQNHPEDPTLFGKLLMKIPDLRTLNTLHSEKLLGMSMVPPQAKQKTKNEYDSIPNGEQNGLCPMERKSNAVNGDREDRRMMPGDCSNYNHGNSEVLSYPVTSHDQQRVEHLPNYPEKPSERKPVWQDNLPQIPHNNNRADETTDTAIPLSINIPSQPSNNGLTTTTNINEPERNIRNEQLLRNFVHSHINGVIEKECNLTELTNPRKRSSSSYDECSTKIPKLIRAETNDFFSDCHLPGNYDPCRSDSPPCLSLMSPALKGMANMANGHSGLLSSAGQSPQSLSSRYSSSDDSLRSSATSSPTNNHTVPSPSESIPTLVPGHLDNRNNYHRYDEQQNNCRHQQTTPPRSREYDMPHRNGYTQSDMGSTLKATLEGKNGYHNRIPQDTNQFRHWASEMFEMNFLKSKEQSEANHNSSQSAAKVSGGIRTHKPSESSDDDLSQKYRLVSEQLHRPVNQNYSENNYQSKHNIIKNGLNFRNVRPEKSNTDTMKSVVQPSTMSNLKDKLLRRGESIEKFPSIMNGFKNGLNGQMKHEMCDDKFQTVRSILNGQSKGSNSVPSSSSSSSPSSSSSSPPSSTTMLQPTSAASGQYFPYMYPQGTPGYPFNGIYHPMQLMQYRMMQENRELRKQLEHTSQQCHQVQDKQPVHRVSESDSSEQVLIPSPPNSSKSDDDSIDEPLNLTKRHQLNYSAIHPRQLIQIKMEPDLDAAD